jgi:hypothetical protein
MEGQMDAKTGKAKEDQVRAEQYVEMIHEAARTGGQVPLPLETDDRVLARVTDGIYRQPASAIRELIANAYDADAEEVIVITDAPRYSQVLVRDDGNGMTADVLVNLIQHIGGSAKRTPAGQKLGVTDPHDPRLSKGGRKLIGKIGIGMFSVSQLTRQFTIITKPREENYRYTAVVTLHRYSDEKLAEATFESTFRNGETVITAETVDEDEPAGTTILLGDLIEGARDILRTKDRWDILLSEDSKMISGRVVPAVHSGFLEKGDDTLKVPPQLPWNPRTSPDERIRLLQRSLIEAGQANELYLQIKHAFDYYFKMLWDLGLSLPLP